MFNGPSSGSAFVRLTHRGRSVRYHEIGIGERQGIWRVADGKLAHRGCIATEEGSDGDESKPEPERRRGRDVFEAEGRKTPKRYPDTEDESEGAGETPERP